MQKMVDQFVIDLETGKYREELSALMKVWLESLRSSDSELLSYLVMMTPRLNKLHNKLKDSGSIYLHCDPTASHYLKVVMDGIFGKKNFVNEIAWCYRTGGASKKHWSRKHDVILMYARNNEKRFFTCQKEKSYITGKFGFKETKDLIQKDTDGRYFTLVNCRDYWDINAVGRTSKERRGYPTQKPIELLDRIIKASCPENGIIMDPFCGCGTTIESAYNLGRSWIGIDICKYAIDQIVDRMSERGIQKEIDYNIYNYPFVYDHIKRLLKQKDGRYAFQDFTIEKIGGISNRKKSGDRGVDGMLYFFTSPTGKDIGKMVLSVKSDQKLQASYIRDLIGTMHQHGTDMAGLISLAEPTNNMKLEAAKAGKFECNEIFGGKKLYPRVQLLTAKEIFDGTVFSTPPTRIFN